MKIGIVGASNFVNRMFEACGPYQWAREFLKNSLEAKATRIEFGIEWQAVEQYGVYRRMIVDDGEGMDRDQLRRFFSTLGEGVKKIGGVHDNFGVGAKIASLPWNPEGIVVISYREGRAAMIEIVLDSQTGEYELIEFQGENKTSCVIDPASIDWSQANEIDWASLRPDWLTTHGTILVLKGSEQSPDTILGNPQSGEADIKGLSAYLNSRFWNLANCDVRVVEVRSEKKNQWPQGPQDRDDNRRPNVRRIRGAKYYLSEIPSPSGKLTYKGEVQLDEDRVKAEWYLWEGDRPAIHSYARKGGYIAVRYNDELFELSSGKVQFRWFGVVESRVQQNLTIILEPQHYRPSNGSWGVHPDQSRNRLIFTGEGQKGVSVPLDTWGTEFSDNLPEPIRAAIYAARGESSGTIESDEYRKRLQDKFGNRWTIKVLVVKSIATSSKLVTATGENVETAEVSDDVTPVRPHQPRKRRKAFKVVVPKATENGSAQGEEREVPVDVPRYRFAKGEDFERPWHLALWQPNDTEGPTVYINTESPILGEVIHYHQERYAEIHSEEIKDTILHVFGEVAVAKIAHSQKLRREMPEELLDKEYRNEAALTIALMGLIAEESLVAQRLAKFGRKRAA